MHDVAVATNSKPTTEVRTRDNTTVFYVSLQQKNLMQLNDFRSIGPEFGSGQFANTQLPLLPNNMHLPKGSDGLRDYHHLFHT